MKTMLSEILLAGPRGFCAGVERAIDIVELALSVCEPPVYVRSDWSLKRKDTKVFHFVLRRDSIRMTTLLSVPDCDAVRGLISDNDWALSPDGEV